MPTLWGAQCQVVVLAVGHFVVAVSRCVGPCPIPKASVDSADSAVQKAHATAPQKTWLCNPTCDRMLGTPVGVCIQKDDTMRGGSGGEIFDKDTVDFIDLDILDTLCIKLTNDVVQPMQSR
jgi:hypothetical protein